MDYFRSLRVSLLSNKWCRAVEIVVVPAAQHTKREKNEEYALTHYIPIEIVALANSTGRQQ
jgi:hypothetical protein